MTQLTETAPITRKYRVKFHGVPTITDVAKAAGVGVATASRVVNNSPLVRAETRKLVEDAIAKVGYLPPEPGKRLRPKIRERASVMTTVAIVLAPHVGFQWISDFAPVYAYALAGVEAALRRHGISCVIHHLSPESEQLKTVPTPKVDGCLILSDTEEASKHPWITSQPCVAFMGQSKGASWCDRVTYNGFRIAELALQSMAAASVTRAVGISTATVAGASVPDQRMSAFASEALRYGIKAELALLDGLLVRNSSAHSTNEMKLEALLKQLFSSELPPQAIFAADILLPSIYRLLRKLGKAPGSDVKVVGCNNERFFLNGLDPAPTVVDLHARRIGERAVEHLLWRVRNPEAEIATVLLEPSLYVPAT